MIWICLYGVVEMHNFLGIINAHLIKIDDFYQEFD